MSSSSQPKPEFGVLTFVDHRADPATGRALAPRVRMQHLIEEAELAEHVGLDVFGVGEHHRPDFLASAPAVVLAAIAARTQRIRLTSAVTVLSSDDPVRVFQEFATLDLLSNGRAEIMAGRGSFTESFPLFGYDLADYDRLFVEKLDLLLKLRTDERITWSGRFRAPITDRGVYPRPLQQPLPVWIAVGGTPQSAQRAGALGLPLAIAIIGGTPDRFVPFAHLYRVAAEEAGHDVATLPLSINSPGYIAETSQQAGDDYFPAFSGVMNDIGRERGWSGMGRGEFDQLRGPHAALVVGSPQQVIDKLLYEHSLFNYSRFMMQISLGPLPHAQALKAIELLGTRVVPAVRAALAG